MGEDRVVSASTDTVTLPERVWVAFDTVLTDHVQGVATTDEEVLRLSRTSWYVVEFVPASVLASVVADRDEKARQIERLERLVAELSKARTEAGGEAVAAKASEEAFARKLNKARAALAVCEADRDKYREALEAVLVLTWAIDVRTAMAEIHDVVDAALSGTAPREASDDE